MITYVNIHAREKQGKNIQNTGNISFLIALKKATLEIAKNSTNVQANRRNLEISSKILGAAETLEIFFSDSF